jgi:methyl coenzyme M reductase gamma subunit
MTTNQFIKTYESIMSQVFQGTITIHQANARLDEIILALDVAQIIMYLDTLSQIIRVKSELGQPIEAEFGLLSYLKQALDKHES